MCSSTVTCNRGPTPTKARDPHIMCYKKNFSNKTIEEEQEQEQEHKYDFCNKARRRRRSQNMSVWLSKMVLAQHFFLHSLFVCLLTQVQYKLAQQQQQRAQHLLSDCFSLFLIGES
jgi:hypothetical protein